jgi:hypothetical protein
MVTRTQNIKQLISPIPFGISISTHHKYNEFIK